MIVYRAATLPIQQPRIERIALRELPDAKIDLQDTIVLPPSRDLEPNHEIRDRLTMIDARSDKHLTLAWSDGARL